MPELGSTESRRACGPKSIAQIPLNMKQASNSGRTAIVLVVLALLFAAGAFAWWSADRAPAVPADVQAAGHGAEEGDGVQRPLPVPPEGQVPMGIEPWLEVGRSEQRQRGPPAPFDESRLEGRGRLRGAVHAPPGVEFPMEWVLNVRPSTSLIGRERAET